MRDGTRIPYLLCAPPLLFTALLLATPLVATLLLSLHGFRPESGIEATTGLGNYLEILSDPYYHAIFLRTLALAAVVTAACVVLGTIEAVVLSRMNPPWRGIFLLVILGPLLISVVVRTLGWALPLGGQGPVSLALQALGVAGGPVSLLQTPGAVVLALVHVLVPFIVVAAWASLQRLNPEIERAGASLGAGEPTILRRLLLPHMLPGILGGAVIVFSLAATAFATPAIIGGRRLKVAATATYDEFLNTLNWPLGAAIAMLLLTGNIAILLLCRRLLQRRRGGMAVRREAAA
ncbi:ABC transporter permease [Inquilinus sp. YAF38]|uniref:ABC transporter permease n=1 Tax=Inquilinus sp. YAF38 TaxID=3233084 RepID=UPI003F93F127